MRSRQRFFDDTTACFVGVSLDPMDETEKRVADHYPGYRYVWDFDGTISPLYGALPSETDGERSPLRSGLCPTRPCAYSASFRSPGIRAKSQLAPDQCTLVPKAQPNFQYFVLFALPSSMSQFGSSNGCRRRK